MGMRRAIGFKYVAYGFSRNDVDMLLTLGTVGKISDDTYTVLVATWRPLKRLSNWHLDEIRKAGCGLNRVRWNGRLPYEM